MSDLKQVVEENFSRYAGNVILDRAICDVRDMLKPSARMLTYSQVSITKNIPSKPFVKSARVVGDCLGHFYTHGDSSCYGTYMRMAKPFAMRYPLEDCQGNSGTINATGDEAAARYTELRLSPLGYSLFKDIEKNTIDDWADNFDETEKYPKILCSKGFYNIVNGSTGIGVSLSASIPQFNLRDINNAMIELIDNPSLDIDILPDFATGGILINPNQVKDSLKQGTGFACKLRSVIEFNEKERSFVVKEFPYGVYADTISEQIKKLVEEVPDCGIESINNGCGKTVDYIIYLTKKANPDKVLKLLYKETSLQSYFTINMNVLTDGGRTPKTLGLKEMLLQHIEHEKLMYKRSFEFDLNKIKHRIHIIDGLLICMANIDEVVHTIKSSASTATAAIALQDKFLLDEEQAKAVLDMKLSKLAHLEIQKLEKEKTDLEKESNRIKGILDNEVLFNNELKIGWKAISNEYGDERRTKIINLEGNAGQEEEIEIKQLNINITNKGNIFSMETSSLYTQKRGGVGNKFKLENGEYVITSKVIDTNEEILFFTNSGNVYHCYGGTLPLEEKISLTNLINIKDNESICAVTSKSNNLDVNNNYIICITKNGMIKKSALSEYNFNRNSGIKAIDLKDGDEIINVLFMGNSGKIGLLTEMGNFLIIKTDDIRPLGRVTSGIHGIKLNNNDKVSSANLIKDNHKLIYSISGNGFIKKTNINEFPIQTKNTKGSKIQKINEDDWMSDFLPIENDTNLIIVTTKSNIKLSSQEIPLLSKGTIGNKAIKIDNKTNIIKLLEN